MSERETQRQGERVGGWSEALAASRWFGAFCIAVSIQAWARSWHVVRKQLGLEKKTKQSWRFTFCFKHGVLLVVPSVISTDCKHGYQRRKQKQSADVCVSENCFPFQTEFTFVFGKKMHRKCLWPKIEPRQRQQQFVRRYQITMCKFPARHSQTLVLSQMGKCMKM